MSGGVGGGSREASPYPDRLRLLRCAHDGKDDQEECHIDSITDG